MRTDGIAALVVMVAAGCGKPPEAPPPPAVTERAKPATTAPATAAPAKQGEGGGFEFEERAAAAPAPKIDAKRRIAPSMDELEAKMAAVAAEEAVPRVWVCGTCGTKAREPGTCCGKDRTPAR